MTAYENNLEHVAEPATPSQREEADFINIRDYEALWFAEVLQEFAYYGDSGELEEIAVAYTDFIEKKVRDEWRSHVSLYAHTDDAIDTLEFALMYAEDNMKDSMPVDLYLNVSLEIGQNLDDDYIETEPSGDLRDADLDE